MGGGAVMGERYAEPLTREQAAVIGAYTGVVCGSFSDLHEYIEKIMGRPVFTHELADRGLADRIKVAAAPDFMALVAP